MNRTEKSLLRELMFSSRGGKIKQSEEMGKGPVPMRALIQHSPRTP